MIRSEIVLTVHGHPKPKGSLKCIGGRGGKGHVLIEDNAGTKSWRHDVATMAKQIRQKADPGQPVGIDATFTLERPAGHYGTGRNARTVKASAPACPVSHRTGDSDKLARLLADALQDAGVFPDDCLVVEFAVRKVYPGDPHPDALDAPGVRAWIYPVGGEQ